MHLPNHRSSAGSVRMERPRIAWRSWVVAGLTLLVLAWAGFDRWLHQRTSTLTALLPDPSSKAALAEDPAELIARLQAENALLRLRLGDLQQRMTLGATAIATAAPLRAHRVIARPLMPPRRFVSISGAIGDQVRPGEAVVVGWTMVGRIEAVGDDRSLVRAVNDPEFRLPCLVVAGGTRIVQGVWYGTARRDQAEIRWVEDADSLEIPSGSPVVSAGDALIPPGLVLGRVASSERPALTARSPGHWQILATPLRDLASETLVTTGLTHDTPPEHP